MSILFQGTELNVLIEKLDVAIEYREGFLNVDDSTLFKSEEVILKLIGLLLEFLWVSLDLRRI